MPEGMARVILDAGEIMGGLRRSHDEATSGGPEDVLPNVWRRPDFAALVKAGRVDAHRAAFFMAINSGFAWRPSPVTAEGGRPEDWAAAWRRSIEVVKLMFDTGQCPDLLQARQVHDAVVRRSFVGTPMEDVAHLAGGRARKVRHPDGSTSWEPRHPFDFDELSHLKAEWLPRMGWPQDPDVTDESFFGVCVTSDALGMRHQPMRVTGRRVERAGLGVRHADPASAEQEAVALQKAAIVQARKDREQGRVGAKTLGGRAVRVGPDNPKRRGRATTSDMVDVLGMRGIEFGATVGQKERQEVLDHAFDACYDLCCVLRLPPRGVSFWGRAGLAFGSRGIGGALGHFEPSHWVVHMDRSMGSGVLAHEMGHALDAALGAAGGCGEGVMLTEAVALGWDGTDLAKLTKQVVDGCRRRPDGRPTAFWTDACALETGRRAYWTQPCEMFARLFEAWVHDMLAKRGRRNDFLVFPGAGTAERVGDEWRVVTSAYPRGKERRDLVDLMEEYLQVAVPMMKARLEGTALRAQRPSSIVGRS